MKITKQQKIIKMTKTHNRITKTKFKAQIKKKIN